MTAWRYSETMTVPQPSDELDCQDVFSGAACRGLGFFREHNGARYCVLHLPCDDKLPEFDEAVRRKLAANDFNFHSVHFPRGATATFSGIAFTHAVFNACTFGGNVDFSEAIFNGPAYFGGSTFKGTASFARATFKSIAGLGTPVHGLLDFRHASFDSDLDFSNVSFDGPTYFEGSTFKGGASFAYATFRSIADFRNATVHGLLDFRYASFDSYFYFEGSSASFKKIDARENAVFTNGGSLSLYLSRVENPERVSFRQLRLQPHWFVATDARSFEFVNVSWDDKGAVHAGSQLSWNVHRYPLLSIAFRQLATNAEENHRYAEASRFRYESMEAVRLSAKHRLAVWRLSWWYWLLSGYSERPGRAAGVLLLMLVLFAAAYTQVTFLPREGAAIASPTKVTLTPTQAAVYAVESALLQKPEPKPATPAGRFLVALETVLGPIQGALLTLAIRRKFMR